MVQCGLPYDDGGFHRRLQHPQPERRLLLGLGKWLADRVMAGVHHDDVQSELPVVCGDSAAEHPAAAGRGGRPVVAGHQPDIDRGDRGPPGVAWAGRVAAGSAGFGFCGGFDCDHHRLRHCGLRVVAGVVEDAVGPADADGWVCRFDCRRFEGRSPAGVLEIIKT
jgi:hypothetical protein